MQQYYNSKNNITIDLLFYYFIMGTDNKLAKA